jgi:hypothetical protein
VPGTQSVTGRSLALVVGTVAVVAMATGGCGLVPDPSSATTGAPVQQSSTAGHAHHGHRGEDHSVSRSDRITAQLATAAFQDVATAEAAGWHSSLQQLGCFEDPKRGGMGVHYINDELMDGVVDVTKPEALVYELDAEARVTGLVAHEYIVPVDAWTKKAPPRLFGVAFHRHPSLPLYVLHAWVWKDNARGDFDDWNPAVRRCPPGVPVFGEDLPLTRG